MDPEQGVARMQAWKFIQKLRILESAINDRVAQGEGPYYPYSARDMMAIDKNTPFNATNTLESRADFNQKVIEASYDKPVLCEVRTDLLCTLLLLSSSAQFQRLLKSMKTRWTSSSFGGIHRTQPTLS